MNRYEQYVRSQFERLKNTKYGFSIKIVDGENNSTNYMELTPDRVKDILKILKERESQKYES